MAQTIGFIGLGIMGRPMAKNLIKAGHPVVVHSRSRGPVDDLVKSAARAASSPREVAAQCDVLITMLPNSPDVEQVALGKDGIIEGAKAGLIFVDMSTISPIVSQKVGKALAAKGVKMLDAPVSGGEKGAIDGALSIMVGGDKATFDAVLPIFQALGKTITLLGPLGFGGFTKLANQIIVAGNLTALAEALTLGKKAGLDRELLLTALAGGLAGSKCLDQKKPNYVAGTYNPGFKIDLHSKDLGLIMESASALGVPVPTTAVVQQLFNAMRVMGPVAVLTHYHNQSIAQQLMRAVQEFFDENKATLHGGVTYPTSAKHLALFHKFGYKPKSLVAVMSRPLDRGGARPALPKPPLAKGALTVRRFSTLEETKKKAALARFHRITNGVCRGLELAKEVEIVDGLALGDTLLLERGAELVGFAIYHAPGVSEAPTGALYVKYLAIDPRQRKVEHLDQLGSAIEDLAQEQGLA